MKANFIVITIVAFIATLHAQPSPNRLWSHEYHYSLFNGMEGNGTQPLHDGGYLISNTIYTTPSQISIIKTDSLGDTLWTCRFSHNHGNIEISSMIMTSDCCLVLVGTTTQRIGFSFDIFIMKINLHGDSLWTRVYGNTNTERGKSIVETSDGGLAVLGEVWTNQFDFWLLKTDTTGDTLWSKIIGTPDTEYASSIKQCSDSGFVMVGSSSFTDIASDMYVVKTNSLGDTLWTKFLGETDYDIAKDVIVTFDNNIIVTGSGHQVGDIFRDVLLIKLNGFGGVVWTRYYGEHYHDEGSEIVLAPDNNYVVAGYTEYPQNNSTYYLLKIDSSGDTLWTRKYPNSFNDYVNDLKVTQDGGYILTGSSCGSVCYSLVVKTGPDQNTEIDNRTRNLPSSFSLGAYPNPFNPSTTISFDLDKESFVKLVVFDITGRAVKTLLNHTMSAGTHKVEFDGSELSSGIYLARMEIAPPSEDSGRVTNPTRRSEVVKMVLLK